MNWKDCGLLDARMERRRWMPSPEQKKEERKFQEFCNRCLREIDGRDAYDYLVYKCSKILRAPRGQCYRFVNYYFDNPEEFDCSFEEWLESDNGPLFRDSIKGLFPEFEAITNDKFEIAKLVRDNYGIEIYHDREYDDYVYSFEFSFKELNSVRINYKNIKDEVVKIIMQELK